MRMKPVVETLSDEEFLIYLFVFYLSFRLTSFLQLILHEAGHLLFGLLTGYRFFSFRVKSFMLIKLEGRLHLKRVSIFGTRGQCRMIPPEPVDGKAPYVLYYLGGSIVNFVVSVIPAVILFMSDNRGIWSGIGIIWAGLGLDYAAENVIPMALEGKPNDGYNVKTFGKHPAAFRSFWIRMNILEQIASGKRIKDLPEEWFEMPEKEDRKYGIVATVAVLCCERLMDQGRYEEAGRWQEMLLEEESGMIAEHRQLLKADLMFCEMVGENRPERLQKLYTEELKQFFRNMKQSPSVVRTQYIYYKYIEKDEMKAEQAMLSLERMKETYPYPHELEGEWEMIAYAKEKFEGHEN